MILFFCRISLMRLNTFGDEVFGDPKVLQSYYYGITQFAVGGRCKESENNITDKALQNTDLHTYRGLYCSFKRRQVLP